MRVALPGRRVELALLCWLVCVTPQVTLTSTQWTPGVIILSRTDEVALKKYKFIGELVP